MQFGVLEVKQQRDFETGNAQIAEHLGDVCIVESRNYLSVGNDLGVHNEIGDEFAYEVPPVVNGILPLLFDRVATCL